MNIGTVTTVRSIPLPQPRPVEEPLVLPKREPVEVTR